MVRGEDYEEVSVEQMEHRCNLCNRRFPSVKSLERHMKSHFTGYVSSDNYQDKNRSIFEEEKKMSTKEADMSTEEAALCLTMMSRDKAGLASTAAKPSDENSAAVEENGSGDESEKPQVSRSRKTFEIDICGKKFDYCYALDGHRASHKRTSGSMESEYEEGSDKTKRATETKSKKNKKVKQWKCPICFRVFSSGQAYGGHKRSHSIKNSVVGKKQRASNM